jgi:small-conductance mechanosensitive channel
VRVLAVIVIGLAAVTVVHVFLGFTGPGRMLRAGTGSVLGFGLIFGATALALYGAVLALFATPLLRWLRSVRDSDPALLRAVRVVLGLLAVLGVALTTLGSLNLTPAALAAIRSLLGSSWEVGTASIAVASLAEAAAIVLGTLLLAAVIEFVLDREIFPRLSLRAGTGYAIATFTRWVLVIVGSMLALVALGIDMAKVTLIAGALGVGIGFGLQNVIANFVSGIILMVERPVSVGDLVEIGPLLGEIRRIGIRSCSLRTAHGAEVIVPNLDLTSKDVVNWTRSDRQRRYDIDVGVAYGSDPERVMRLLVEAAAQVPEVMASPAPLAMFRGLGDKTLDFTLLVWVTAVEVGMQAQTALRVAVLHKLADAGIAMASPPVEVQAASDNEPGSAAGLVSNQEPGHSKPG